MTDKGKFGQGMAILLDTFRETARPRTLEAYWSVVSGLDDAEFTRATERALRECDFMPAPGKLLELAGRDRRTGRKTEEDVPEYHRPFPD